MSTKHKKNDNLSNYKLTVYCLFENVILYFLFIYIYITLMIIMFAWIEENYSSEFKYRYSSCLSNVGRKQCVYIFDSIESACLNKICPSISLMLLCFKLITFPFLSFFSTTIRKRERKKIKTKLAYIRTKEFFY